MGLSVRDYRHMVTLNENECYLQAICNCHDKRPNLSSLLSLASLSAHVSTHPYLGGGNIPSRQPRDKPRMSKVLSNYRTSTRRHISVHFSALPHLSAKIPSTYTPSSGTFGGKTKPGVIPRSTPPAIVPNLSLQAYFARAHLTHLPGTVERSADK